MTTPSITRLSKKVQSALGLRDIQVEFYNIKRLRIVSNGSSGELACKTVTRCEYTVKLQFYLDQYFDNTLYIVWDELERLRFV